ncbi:MAG: hypothetical protein FWD53_03025 [Phycisphaerales bacterium]|nr:hypothetical protein [Phycisphaerales bacterium]
MTSLTKILGLAIGPKSLLFAELTPKKGGGGGKPFIQRLAEFPFPEKLSFATPIELGQAVAKFLAKEKIATRDVVIGLPARRLVTRRKDVPPASPIAAAATLRLQAETEFMATTTASGEPDTFVFDYAGQVSSSGPSSVLLVATAQSGVDQCVEFAKAAGLKLRGITASSLALTGIGTKPTGDSMILSFAGGAAELLVLQGQVPAQLRHIAAGSSEAALVGEIRRSGAALQRASVSSLSLWDDGTQDPKLLEQRLGFPVHANKLASLAQTQGLGGGQSLGLRAELFAPAVAVAIAASQELPIDFLHSRLAPPKESSNKRPLTIALSAVAAILLIIAGGLFDLHLKRSRLSDLNTKSLARASEVKVAQAASNRLDEANRWLHRSSRHVECLRDLTAIFPDEGTIWATSLSLSNNNKGVLIGSAASEAQVRALKDLMLKSQNFINPTPKITSVPRVAEVNFTINFDYKPKVKITEAPPPDSPPSSTPTPSLPNGRGSDSPTTQPEETR